MTLSDKSRTEACEIARCYALYRPLYPRDLLDDLLARARVSPTDSLLDLACGTGRVALAIAPAFAAVTAIDLEPEMIARGRAIAAERRIGNITWQVGRVEDVELGPCAYRLVTIGDALHRFQEDALLDNVRGWLVPGGAIAILRSFDTLYGSEPWHRDVLDIVTRWTGRDAAQLTAPTHTTEQCETLLRRLGFDDVSSHTFTVPHVWSAEGVIGNLASTSYCARHVLGAGAEGFAEEVTRTLASRGVLRETLSFGYTFGRA